MSCFFADDLAADVADAGARTLQSLLDSPVPASTAKIDAGGRLWTVGEPIHEVLTALRECALSTVEQGEVDRHLRLALDRMAHAADQVAMERDRIDAARAETRAELHRRVLLGKAYLDASLETGFDLGAAAAVACLSPHHFHRTFRVVLGRTPFGYVTQRRVERAKRLLLEKDWDVIEISTSLGYQSLPSFTRLFKKETGHSPGAYRVQFRKGR
ncbi:MAG: helix-turn-helix transcriptional regulator [Betaproteobacteria bacterium]|nr:helix-turn-helix transcriptional regulator [Betaproteobacteria bacterium]